MNLWPLLVFVPAALLYFYFKLTIKDLTGNWFALLKDGLASGAAFLLAGGVLFFAYPDGALRWVGLALAVWSLTYFGSALISWRSFRSEQQGKRVAPPFSSSPTSTPAARSSRPNRAQRRGSGRKKGRS